MPRPELSTLRYPNLWQGCVGAWCPSQSGATGYRLFDDSGNNNHGVLTNMDPGTDWVPSGGKLALDFDGSNDYVSIASIAPALGFSFSAWFKAGATTKARHSIFSNADDSGPDIYLHLENVTGSVYQMNFYNGTAYLGPSSTFTLDFNFHHYCWTTDQQGGVYYWSDGVYLGKASTSWTPINRNKQASLGAVPVLIGSAFTAWGTLDDCRRYNRALAPYEIRQLASSRGAAYERSRGRKKAYVQGYRITAPSRIQTGSARTIDGTDTESLSRGLIGAWCPSLGASGYRLIDRSGNGNHGVLTNMDPGTDWVPSGGKLALDFDGVNDQILANNTVAFAHDNKISIGCWAKVTSNGNRTVLVNFGSSFELWYPLFDGGSTIALAYPGASPLQSVSNSTVFNEWVHIFITRGGASSGLSSIYLNGIKLSLLTDTVSNHPAITSSTFIGCRDGATRFAVALLDDIRVYNRVLTSSEIRLLYTGGRGVGLLPEAKPKRARIVAWDNQDKISVPARVLTNTDSLKRGLVGHWSPSVSGPQGNRLMDLSGQNNHGTLTNMDYQTDYVPSTDKGGRMALDFDGVNDVVTFSQLSLGTIHTTAAWVYLRFPVAFDFHGTCGDGTNNTCSLAASGNGVSITNIAYSWSTTSVSVTVPDFIGRWTHIATARIGDRVEFFYNGNSYGSVSGASIPSFNCNRIGQRNGSVFTNGIIDDFRIYNRALTPSEIRLLAQSRMPERATPQRTRTVFYSSGLVSYLRRRTYNSILGSGVLS